MDSHMLDNLWWFVASGIVLALLAGGGIGALIFWAVS